MTPEDLDAIRARDAAMPRTGNGITKQHGRSAGGMAIRDRRDLLAEVDRLRALVNDGIPWTCIYCGRLWPVSEPVDVLREHVIVCEKHPAARALPVIEAARALVNGLPLPLRVAGDGHPIIDTLTAHSDEVAALRAALAAWEGEK